MHIACCNVCRCSVYDGEWKDGNMEGLGIKIDQQGGVQQGEFNEDRFVKPVDNVKTLYVM